MNDPSVVESIFVAALAKDTAEARAAYLAEACKDNSELRHQVEQLLEAHPKAVHFLEPDADVTGSYGPVRDQVGAVIAGRFKLLEQIGEGGMGTVWVAEQTRPVRRKVALKLIKAGMDTKQVLARFEAERQALALMDHPNIAKVLDGGVTEQGRPFFVMEYVKGVQLMQYCDDACLTVEERLALFIPVCQAVQHAHQKGIVHRDLKPSNVLVCLYDGKPVPKVIDFGLAKAMLQPLTEHTLYTGHGVMLGTPLYMSPEQAGLNNLDIDTRTDIYSLGVILYELLTGSTPLEKQRFKAAAWQEMIRLIKEEEPLRPSIRLSGSGTLPSLAAQRRMEPVKLSRLVRGDLDWIVMKSLEKDRNRRYETATGFAADVKRYLDGEAVHAHPPSKTYRMRKFMRKHRVVIATASAFLGMLIAAVGVSGALAVNARRARVIADLKRIEADANAKEAKRNSELYLDSVFETAVARMDAQVKGIELQADLDLAEIHSDARVGLLQLTRTLMKEIEPLKYRTPDGVPMAWHMGGTNNDLLHEFGTMAVLATGQTFAPLLPPITHDGSLIRSTILSSTGDRLLTRGNDKTARLWDAFTGQPIAILRHAQENVVEAGLSPDGATAFTHSEDGVVRLWETKDGAFRAETEARPNRLQVVEVDLSHPNLDPYNNKPGMTQISNERILTRRQFHNLNKDGSTSVTYPGPIELWDTKTGRLIASLKLPKDVEADFIAFFGDGRWIEAVGHNARFIHLLSAQDGRLLTEINPYFNLSLCSSPDGKTISFYQPGDDKESIQTRETVSWTRTATTGPLAFSMNIMSRYTLEYITNDLLAAEDDEGGPSYSLYAIGSAKPLIRLPAKPQRLTADRVLLGSGQLFDRQSWRRLLPPKGHKYHPDLGRFAADGRFFLLDSESKLLDTVTEKTIPQDGRWHYRPSVGWARDQGGDSGNTPVKIHRLPPPHHMEIPTDLLELWAQIAVRGHLDDEGTFVKWDEPTWEKHRQELAAKPVPYPDFPFPGHVATDRLHWLRQEYGNANDAEKSRLAKQLLDRAEAAGDKAEAVRWRTILTPAKPKGDSAVPPAPK